MYATAEPRSGTEPVLSVEGPLGRPYTETGEFGKTIVFATLVAGALIGAGTALLLAPKSGKRTRRTISRRVRRLTGREKSTWDRLGRTLAHAAAAARSKTAATRRSKARGGDEVDREMRSSSELARAL